MSGLNPGKIVALLTYVYISRGKGRCDTRIPKQRDPSLFQGYGTVTGLTVLPAFSHCLQEDIIHPF